MKFVANTQEERDYLERVCNFNEAMRDRESDKQRRRHRMKTKSGRKGRKRYA